MKITLTFDPTDPADVQAAQSYLGSPAPQAGPVTDPHPTPVTAPAAPVAAIAAQHDLTDLDDNGHPWDSRIHQRAKGKTAKNIWKVIKAPKLDAALRDQVLAELTATYPVTGDTATPPPPPGAATPPPPPGAVLTPGHQAVVDKVALILAQMPSPTEGSFEHYQLEQTETLPALGELMNKWDCPTIDHVGDLDPTLIESLQQALDYVWPTQ